MLEVFESRDALYEAAAQTISDALGAALDARGRASLIGSGGSTPAPVYERLRRTSLDWPNTAIGLADERWVSPHDEASNQKLLRETLLQDNAENSLFVPMKTPDRDPGDAADIVDAAYRAIGGPAFDVMVLGMGADGHSLSWFPGADGLEDAINPDALKLVAGVHAKRSDVTGDNLVRMTLTYPCVEKTRLVLLLITGEEKRRVLEAAGADAPISKVVKAAGDRLRVFWAP